MLSSSNLVFLSSLGVVSWVILCIFSTTPRPKENFRIQELQELNAIDFIKYGFRWIISLTCDKNCNLMLYLLCTLCGVFVLANVISRKVKTITFSLNKDDRSNLKSKVNQLREEIENLTGALRQQRLKKSIYFENVSLKASLIQQLQRDLQLVKEENQMLRRNMFPMINIKTSTSETYMNNFHLEDYDALALTPSNHDIINRILKEAYEKDNLYGSSYNSYNNQYLEKIYEESDVDTLTIATDKTEEETAPIANNSIYFNIVSTDQLEKIKGLSVSALFSKS